MRIARKRPNLSLKIALDRLSSADADTAPSTPPSSSSEHYLVEILPNLYVADNATAKCADLLRANGISVVFNLISHKCPNQMQPGFSYENFELSDNNAQDLSLVIEDAILRLENYLQSGSKVVVHCSKGVSRAPSAIIAYLIKVKCMTFEEAFDLVRGKSPRIEPNAGFLMQLSYLI